MVALVKYKNPVEYSFYIWMSNFPESTHPSDSERFCIFVKNVCYYHAKKWKSNNFLEKKILETKPRFDQNRLQILLIKYEAMIDFYEANSYPRSWYIDNSVDVTSGYYIERGMKGGKPYEVELPMP